MTKQVLITGATGDIGRSIAAFLETKNIAVLKLTRDTVNANTQSNSIFNINKLSNLINQTTATIHLAGILNNIAATTNDLAVMLCINGLFTALISKIIRQN